VQPERHLVPLRTSRCYRIGVRKSARARPDAEVRAGRRRPPVRRAAAKLRPGPAEGLAAGLLHRHGRLRAARAYDAKTKVNLKNCQGGPGSCYCSLIGGTDEFGGVTLAGGGWVLSTDVNNVLDVCAFPDLSAIDAYGLFYHAYGIIRGQNLKGLLRFPDPY
jgi:hypothetical protein